jgi:hypothetical protein
MTTLGDAIDTIDPQERDACVHAVAAAIKGHAPASVVLACLYFALLNVPLLDGDTEALIDDLPRLGRNVLAGQAERITRQ